MKNTFKKLFLFLALATAVSSCDSVGDDQELNYGTGAYVAQFPFSTRTGLFLKDDAVIYNYDVPVKIVGGNGLGVTTDVTVTFEQLEFVQDDTDAADDTYVNAVEGVDFEFVNPTNSFVIPAGSSFGSIPIRVLSGNLNDLAPSVLRLRITDVDGGTSNVVLGTTDKIDVVLLGTCASDLAKTYNLVTTRLGAGTVYNLPGEVVSMLAAGQYLTSSTGPYNNRGLISSGAQLTAGPSAGFIFNEICGRIALEVDQNLGGALGGGYSNSVYQTPAQYAASSVDHETGVIIIEYSIEFASGDRQYRGVYTPIVP